MGWSRIGPRTFRTGVLSDTYSKLPRRPVGRGGGVGNLSEYTLPLGGVADRVRQGHPCYGWPCREGPHKNNIFGGVGKEG